MTEPVYTVSKISSVCRGTVHSIDSEDLVIRDLLIDSRRLIHPEFCLFVALVSERNNGHKFIEELYEKGVRCFMVSELPRNAELNASFILVPDTLAALQELSAYHRRQFDIPVIGIYTMKMLRKERISVLAVQANRCIFLELGRVVVEADRLGVALVSVNSEESM